MGIRDTLFAISCYNGVIMENGFAEDGSKWYKQRYMEVYGGARSYENRLNRTGWYVLACTDPYDSIWVCCPAAGFAAAILPGL